MAGCPSFAFATVACAILGCGLAGCGTVQAVRDDLAQMDQLARLAGEVTVEDWTGAPIVVAVLRSPEREGLPYAIVDYTQLFQPGPYFFVVEPGRYRLAAFVDENRDVDLNPGEHVAPYDEFRELEAPPGWSRDLDIAIAGPPPRADERMPEVAYPTGESRSLHVGAVLPLDDERFGPAAGRLGVMEPTRFMRELGAGIWLLEEHDPDRVPVLFVHGISGYPQEFDALIEGLDASRYEAWVAQYPSGWDLEYVASFMNRAMNELATVHSLERMCVVAHSMGGVVMRRTMTHHAAQRPAPFIRGFVTIASPLGGHPGAGAGAAMSPVVVPSWRSLVPTGALIRGLYEPPLPDEIRYALFFAFSDEDGDGVVPLSSQLRPEAALEADLVRGFVATHVGVLEDPGAIRALGEELERCRTAPAP